MNSRDTAYEESMKELLPAHATAAEMDPANTSGGDLKDGTKEEVVEELIEVSTSGRGSGREPKTIRTLSTIEIKNTQSADNPSERRPSNEALSFQRVREGCNQRRTPNPTQ